VGNDLFAWFETPFTKSRVNFLTLRQTEPRYRLDEHALEYRARHGLAPSNGKLLATHVGREWTDAQAWRTFLAPAPREIAVFSLSTRITAGTPPRRRSVSLCTHNQASSCLRCDHTTASKKESCR
jgi:hypothetical protein